MRQDEAFQDSPMEETEIIFDPDNQAELVNKKEGLPEVKLSDFKATHKDKVGSGTYGEVYKALLNNDAT